MSQFVPIGMAVALIAMAPDSVFAQADYDPYAGVQPDFAAGASLICSSNPGGLRWAFDGDPATHWQSDAFLPYGYVPQPGNNVLLYATDGRATDGLLHTAEVVEAGVAFRAPLPSDRRAVVAHLKAGLVAPADVFAVAASGERLRIGTVELSQAYRPVAFDLPKAELVALEFTSAARLQVFECSALRQNPVQYAGYLREHLHEVQEVTLRSWPGSGGALASRLEFTRDGQRWRTLHELDPDALQVYTIRLDTAVRVRGLRIAHEPKLRAWAKVSVWELAARGPHGRYGPPPT